MGKGRDLRRKREENVKRDGNKKVGRKRKGDQEEFPIHRIHRWTMKEIKRSFGSGRLIISIIPLPLGDHRGSQLVMVHSTGESYTIGPNYPRAVIVSWSNQTGKILDPQLMCP